MERYAHQMSVAGINSSFHRSHRTATYAPSGQYGTLALPVVAMAGDGDLIVHRAKHAERLAVDIADADLGTVPGQGHLVHYAAPDQVIGAIDSVIEGASDLKLLHHPGQLTPLFQPAAL